MTEEDILLSYRLEHGLPIIGVASIVDTGIRQQKIIVQWFDHELLRFNLIWIKTSYDKQPVFNKYPKHEYYTRWAGFDINFWYGNQKLVDITQQLLDNTQRRKELISFAAYSVVDIEGGELKCDHIFSPATRRHMRARNLIRELV